MTTQRNQNVSEVSVFSKPNERLEIRIQHLHICVSATIIIDDTEITRWRRTALPFFFARGVWRTTAPKTLGLVWEFRIEKRREGKTQVTRDEKRIGRIGRKDSCYEKFVKLVPNIFTKNFFSTQYLKSIRIIPNI